MITTKQINVNLSKGKLKLRQVTTKEVDASLRVEPPKEPIKLKKIASITTTTLPDVADIAEKKRRDDIAKEKKLAMKDEKKIAMAEKEVEGKTAPAIVKNGEGKSIPIIKEVKKKPWKDMSGEEKKVAYKERAQRAKVTREAKRKKK